MSGLTPAQKLWRGFVADMRMWYLRRRLTDAHAGLVFAHSRLGDATTRAAEAMRAYRQATEGSCDAD